MACPSSVKDGPRPDNAPRRGWPPKPRDIPSQEENGQLGCNDEYEFDDEEYSEEFLRRLDKAESNAIAKLKRLKAEADACKKCLVDLQEAVNDPLSCTNHSFHCNMGYSYFPIEPFFNPLAGPLSDAASDEDEHLDSQNKAETLHVSRNTGDEPAAQRPNANDEPGVWFDKPKYMQDWLYRYFATVIHPLIHNKNGGKILLAPPTFTESKPYALPTLWIHSPEPVMSLSVHRFEPTLLFRLHVLLWLVHFFVDVLSCPQYGKPLEKNGALPPHHVVDLEDSFYIIAWAYYC
ncbi:uncharacterized protein EV420DRAFT_1639210 [Desarmillaria tabescens]|uniref:Uncharacterized protein n=1 Tax=Armillaria tabescens TaxID=1929756 RepID=A0AA39NCQ8_ARMTA|nr:uncharacterized protein EV420DRAFT_1639210 [Desarmillaria tabescens]KAK0463129.1 hypothetical protein EV420DRAFT_1639210 [Desarmillaria tabescens]